ncbi:hypothetical protein J437_LFUL003861 [Ladona fulva]|uniref:Uncharacterized protein n=1 Tax=Ladona fulva TaxID=123851 RepID=A0A8K0K6Z9_LADFU|nr:hypothetical protein J437_LFUL003861 [Ladona fulva]
MEVMPMSLDLFQCQAVQTSVTGNRTVPYKILSSLDNQSTLEFSVSKTGDSYIDLSTIELELIVKLCKADGSDHSGDVNLQPGVVNNTLHSLFDQCNESAESHLACDGWAIDTGDEINKRDSTNVGFTMRRNNFANSKIVQLVGKLHGDIFSQSQYLLTGANLSIKLSLAKPSFYIMEEDAKDSTLKTLDATLHVRHFDINPSILMTHNTTLTKTNAFYPYKRVEVKSFTAPSGSQSISHDNVILGTIPNMLIFAMVDNDAFVGRRSKNLFALSHYSITDFSIFVSGVQTPMHGLSMNFDLKKYWTRAYRSLFSGVGIDYADKGNQITMEMFAHGFFILAFDMTPDSSVNEDHISIANSGSVQIDAKFEKVLP